MTSELKPCPFCGESSPSMLIMKRLDYPISRDIVKCINCDGQSPFGVDADDAIAKWNTRKSIPIAALEAFIEENKDEYLSSDDIIGFSIEVYDLQALIDKYKT